MNRWAAAVRVGVFVLLLNTVVAGCTCSPSCDAAKSPRATAGKPYRIELRFDSGGVLEAVDFDDRFWFPVDAGWKPTILPIPPSTLHGTITLRANRTRDVTDTAQFVSDRDERVLLKVQQVACA
jgi:hypothetical protein